ncbi:Zn(II)2Cys6 transcription factor domain-containing protein [Aspergillus saccharolyticus JOP 1030-1]|uniref:Zn(2)-C6 fungal-type domain-containing protein n=1 Tax=Aspergillus saccharolyticus JOP 1030-1 TaxID=1450539 RepID=A0A318ZKQ1_9EURO|nr:hypothetical protein BP01DRAFT_372824 [Aspergillus saccharolyticus JOP 1030-1]PYH46974.1 hypothetical protein BP01DRAFT_372824 [Aspergillus saccharolyticus JOP 1030-1]
MPGVPSNKACERCKKRHLKCDEARPQCQRCINAAVDCPGYVQTCKFIDQGAAVRRRYAPYHGEQVNRHHNPANTLGNALTSKQTLPRNPLGTNPDAAGRAMPGPSRVQSATTVPAPGSTLGIHQLVSNSPAGDSLQSSSPGASMQARSIIPTPDGFSQDIDPAGIVRPDPFIGPPWNDVRSSSTPKQPFNDLAYGSAAMTPRRRQESSHTEHTSPQSPSQADENESIQDMYSDLISDSGYEESFLVRYYVEALAPWLDLSDPRKFFATHVPLRAKDDVALRYSITALAAKHLGRMKGVKITENTGLFTTPAMMETYSDVSDAEWLHKATTYCYLAGQRLNTALSESYTAVSSSAVLKSPFETINDWLRRQYKKAPSDSETQTVLGKRLENSLAVSTILNLYKSMDEPAENWHSHLSGVKPLFETIVRLFDDMTPAPTSFPPGVIAAFWNVVRQDYLTSYLNRMQTHLDPNNFKLWRYAGIPLDDEGNIGSIRNTFSLPEDLSFHSLARLSCKVVNFMAESKKSFLQQLIRSPSVEGSGASSPYPTTSTWLDLSFEYQAWVERLPESFRPCVRLDKPRNLAAMPGATPVPFPEVYYSLPSYAFAMQMCHFGRLALSLNRPADALTAPSTAFDRVQGYRELTKEVDYRCKEIIGIALARPQTCARVYMAPLLFAVGQFQEALEEQQIVVDLLRGIEADLGWETDSKIKALQTLWNHQ